jgi:hypothetical protein
VKGGKQCVEARGEACQFEYVLVRVHQTSSGIGEGEEQAARRNIICRRMI